MHWEGVLRGVLLRCLQRVCYQSKQRTGITPKDLMGVWWEDVFEGCVLRVHWEKILRGRVWGVYQEGVLRGCIKRMFERVCYQLKQRIGITPKDLTSFPTQYDRSAVYHFVLSQCWTWFERRLLISSLLPLIRALAMDWKSVERMFKGVLTRWVGRAWRRCVEIVRWMSKVYGKSVWRVC